MLDKTGLITFLATCDNCDDEEHQTDHENFFDALEEIKELGWTVKKVDNEWEHWCPGCSKDGIQKDK